MWIRLGRIPLSTVKRYLPDDLQRIRLSDLLHDEIDRTMDELGARGAFAVGSPVVDANTVAARLQGYAGRTIQVLRVLSRGKSDLAHRIVWRLCYGPILRGLDVDHKYDVGLCDLRLAHPPWLGRAQCLIPSYVRLASICDWYLIR